MKNSGEKKSIVIQGNCLPCHRGFSFFFLVLKQCFMAQFCLRRKKKEKLLGLGYC